MRIAIDARMMGPANTRGIGRYIEELVRAMIAQSSVHRFVLLTRNPDASPFIGHPSVEHLRADVPWYGLAEQMRMPFVIRASRADLLHVPHWNIPLASFIPRVVTIHDLILLEEPLSASITTRGPLVAAAKRVGYRAALHAAVRHSRRILVPTQYVADWIKKRFIALKTPVDVTGEGMGGEAFAVRHQQFDHRPQTTDFAYVLVVGSAYPHKNLDVLIPVWKVISVAHPELRLHIVGRKDAFMHQFESRIVAAGLPRVVFFGQVSNEELSSQYVGAVCLVFPSRFEGFGLPPLEALAHGCPVASSSAACLPEVLGQESAFFFNPDSPDAIVGAIESLLRDPVGARERALHAAAQLRHRHDWRLAAERTLESYERAIRP